NLYQWNLRDGTSSILWKGKGIVSSIAISNDGRYVAAISLSTKNWGEIPIATSAFVLYDLQEKRSALITSHGNRVYSVTFDPSGTRLVTGDLDGIVRVGPIRGETPHLLMGHERSVGNVAVDPSGKWI